MTGGLKSMIKSTGSAMLSGQRETRRRKGHDVGEAMQRRDELAGQIGTRPWAVVMVMVDEVRPWLEHGSSDSLFYGGRCRWFEDEGQGGCLIAGDVGCL
ncbi:hypothetical protein M0R45_016048 [Rubus argutus]|uniref:Uncharacterized protein n=1 Tax=Rubus argutus TaxID=59490 RepID=A0AAW1XSK0_RUBAR